MTLIYISPTISATIIVTDIVRPTALVISTVVGLIKQYIIGCVRPSSGTKRVGGVWV